MSPVEKSAARKDDDEQVIDLTKVVTRRPVRVRTKRKPAGEMFELRTIQDFGVVEQQRLLRMGKQADALILKEGDDDLSEEEEARLQHLMDRMFHLVLDAPEEVRETIGLRDRGQVVMSFTMAPLLANLQAMAEATAQVKDPTDSTSAS